jgi:hypothetical protein
LPFFVFLLLCERTWLVLSAWAQGTHTHTHTNIHRKHT